VLNSSAFSFGDFAVRLLKVIVEKYGGEEWLYGISRTSSGSH
jgi:hypothetical protein